MPSRKTIRRMLPVIFALLSLVVILPAAAQGSGPLFLPILFSRGYIAPTQQPTAVQTPSLTQSPQPTQNATLQPAQYVLLSWNDLGMHCYNRDFADLAVLPPFNNLWAQVIRRGDPPQIVTTGIEISYSFPNNSYSVGKSNFWQYAQALFGLAQPLAPNTGLTGAGLAGRMTAQADHFLVEGIPLTEFEDSAPSVPQPYQLAEVVARETATSRELARLTVVAPVSTEMRCDRCHSDGQREGIATGKVETNILTLHDRENQDDYPPGHTGPLMSRRPVLCAECHASIALALNGVQGLPSLSQAMHGKHSGIVPNTLAGCYDCHPGPQTKCLRDVMSTRGMDCIDCHTSLNALAGNRQPWLDEPRCSDSGCHPDISMDKPLYRQSKGHGGVYCAACHDSPHAIAPSTQPRDALKFMALQGSPGPLEECTVCHLTQPEGSIH